MYKTGDKFIIEIDSVMTNKKGKLYGVKGFNSLVFDENGLDRMASYNEEFDNNEEVIANAEKYGYDKGLSDAWECAKQVYDLSFSDVKEIYGEENDTLLKVMRNFTPQKAIEKLKAWKTFQEVKKECEGCSAWDGYDCSRTQEEDCLKEIKVGDVIKSCNGNTAVIQYIDAWDMWQCFNKNGGSFTLDHEKQRYWKKTGKHIDLTMIFKGLEEEGAD